LNSYVHIFHIKSNTSVLEEKVSNNPSCREINLKFLEFTLLVLHKYW
jgi:hypothetical protein